MPPYRYDPYDSSRWTGSLADIIRLQGQIPAEALIRNGQAQARAAEQQGAIWGNAINGITHALASVPGDIVEGRRQAQADEIRNIQLQRAKDLQRGEQAVDALMTPRVPNGPMPEGETRPAAQNPYLDANGLYDIPKLHEALAGSGLAHLAPELLKSSQAINDSILEHQQRQTKLAQSSAVLYGDMADGVMKLVNGGFPIDRAMDLAAAPGIATKLIEPQAYGQIRAKILSLPPEQQQAALTNLMDAAAKLSPPKTLADGAQEIDRYGRVVATNEKTPTPGQGDYTINGQRFNVRGEKIGDVQPPQHTPAAKSLQSKSVLLDGKPAEVSYDPSTGRYLLPSAAPNYGTRFNSTDQKGDGFLGPLQRPDGSAVMSEYSIGVQINGKETEIPTLVPTLTKQEVQTILTMKDGAKVPDAIVQKARAYAEQRIAAGKSPFASAGEQQNLYPDLKRVESGGMVDVTTRVRPIPPASETKKPTDQNALEKEYRTVLARGLSSRSGGLGLEDAKVQQANHLLALMDQNFDPKTGQYNIPKVMLGELALGLARLTSPGGQVGVQLMEELNQKTAKGDVNGVLTYLTGKPFNGSTQDVYKMFRDSIQRQGEVAMENREGEMRYLRGLAPTELDEGRRKQLERLSLNPLRQTRTIRNTKTGETKTQTSTDGGETWK